MANEEVEKEKRELELQRQQRFSGSRFVSGGEQANDFKGTMSRLLKLLKPQLPLILLTFVMTIAYTVASTYAPNKLADMVDIITDGIRAKSSGGGIDFGALRHAALIVGLLYALTVVCNLIQQFIMIDVSQNLVYDMRRAIDIKLKKLPIKYFDSHSRGDILSRVANDVENISMTLQMSLTQIISAIITLVSVLFFMFYRNWLLTLISLVTVVLCVVLERGGHAGPFETLLRTAVARSERKRATAAPPTARPDDA